MTQQAHSLTTALEYLAEERAARDNDASAAYKRLTWFDPTLPLSTKDVSTESTSVTLPLYPLSATYLPVPGVNHTLNNIQPRNIRMALDLAADADSENSRFCVTLSALDTGRLAYMGAIMRLTNVETQVNDGTIARIVVTCYCEEIVRIIRVENPAAALAESRIRKSDEYLTATVVPYASLSDITATATLNGDSNGSRNDEHERLASRFIDEYSAVRNMYLNGVGYKELPPFALDTLAVDLPALSHDAGSMLVTDSDLFWKTAQIWQQLCHTVAAACQMRLSADRNELMVAAAMQKGGPLQLPVHPEDLSPADRRRLEQMELGAQEEWLAKGLDPCLDFQCLLTLKDPVDRIHFFTNMVTRERQRLQEEAARQPIEMEETNSSSEQPRKGAWFEDE